MSARIGPGGPVEVKTAYPATNGVGGEKGQESSGQDVLSLPTASVSTQPPRDPRNGQIRYVQLYLTDLMGDTHRLSHDAMGVYTRMFCTAVLRQEHLPDDPDRIARLIGLTKSEWAPIRDELVDFGVVEPLEGLLYDRRAQRGIDEFRKRSERGKNNVAARYRPPARGLEDAS